MNKPLERRSLPVRQSALADVQVELTLFTFNKLMITIVLSGIGLIGATWMLAYHYHDPVLWILGGVMTLVWVARAAVVVSFPGESATLTILSASQWERRYGCITLLFCTTLAFSTIYNFEVHDQTAWILCTLGTFMYCGGLSARLGTRPWIVHSSSFVTLAALGWSVVRQHDVLARTGTVLVIAFAYTQYETVRGKFEIVVEQLRTKRKLREYAEQDVLTGLVNRRFFTEELARMCVQTQQFAILFLDLDRFKAVNDSFGHATGDALLQLVAGRLREAVRKEDIVARLGGDEFAILQVPITDEAAATALARRINRTLAEPFSIEGQHISIGASVGIKLSAGTDPDPNRLLSQADDALYTVKHAGRGSFAVA